MEMFEKASRLKLRFDTGKGSLSVEDLWDLPLQSSTGRTNLDEIAITMHSALKDENNVSFVDPDRKSKGSEMLQLSFDIVRRVIEVRVAEANTAKEAKSRAEKKQHLLSILADKEHEEWKGKSAEDIRKAIAEL